MLRSSNHLFAALPEGAVGLTVPDDAAVMPVPGAPPGTPSLVLTTDFFTPIVDDPETFGRIAATNAISDVYAMGGTPCFALNLAAFPTKTLPLEILAAILAGGARTCAEEGVLVVGGHTIDDPEPKFGCAVIGTVDPARVWTKRGGRAGDALVLTKALGTGILATAFKRDAFGETDERYQAMVGSMTTSNRRAAALARPLAVHGATDVTGYGLLGHLLETLADGALDAELDADAVRVLPGVRALIEGGFVPGGTAANLAFVAPKVRFSAEVDATTQKILADAQTSGGLLLALPPADAERFVAEFGEPSAVVGRLVPGSGMVAVGRRKV